ncbi:hypothetical protein [Plantactinospora sp. GCM10030261]|uniref:hypothetical protein n=1 Tax=Plantactinospora sp. GCM10030261 TaxID=3273420 RepID=UPI00360BD17C
MSVGIDDLLGDADEPPARPRRGGGGARVLRTLLIAGAITAVVLAGLRVVGVAVSAIAVLAGVLTLLVVRRVAAGLAPPPSARIAPASPGGDPSWVARDALDRTIGRWEHTLGWAEKDVDRYNTRVLPRLGALADERLRQRHGLTRRSDPARARALLGEAAWHTLATEVRRPPSPRELAALVAELERI